MSTGFANLIKAAATRHVVVGSDNIPHWSKPDMEGVSEVLLPCLHAKRGPARGGWSVHMRLSSPVTSS